MLLLAGVMSAPGCRSGVAAGEGPGIKSLSDGELNGNVPGSLDAAKDALLQTLVGMGVQNADQQQNPVLVVINARTLQNVALEIKVTRISDDLTKIRIRAGEGDLDLARTIYNDVRQQLERQMYRD